MKETTQHIKLSNEPPRHQLFKGQLPLTTGALREFALLRVFDDDGHEGWGEIAPLPGYSPDTLEQALAEANTALVDPETRGSEMKSPSLAWATSSAYRNLEANRLGVPLARAVSPMAAKQIRINTLITEVDDPASIPAGEVVKCKVGGRSPQEEVERLKNIPGRLRLDANRRLNLNEALALADALQGLNIEYLEEPVSDFNDLPAFLDRSGIPVALDESLREHPAEQLEDLDLAALVYKPTVMGGWLNLVHWQDFALRKGLKLTISAAFETGIGIWNLANVAAGLEGISAYAGLDTYRFLADDVIEPRLDFTDACLDLSQPFARTFRVKTENLEEIFHG